MFSLRPAARALAATQAKASEAVVLGCWSKRSFSSVVEKDSEEEDDWLSPVEKRRFELQKKDKHLVWESPEALPAAPLPENIKELTALDPTDLHVRQRADGSDRLVIIRQEPANLKQSPLNPEKNWRISFIEDGVSSEKWKNSLMGWNSSGDPYQSQPPLIFKNATDAVYFAQKRNWNFVVKEPIMRKLRDDGAQYQDNFLPQEVAAKVMKDRKQCDHWHRSAAGASHYFRPLKYHGEGVVDQHGPTGDAPIDSPVESYYKRR